MVKSKVKIPVHSYKYDFLQINEMKIEHPDFKYYRENGRLFFSGYVQPSATMAKYKIRIEYRKNKMPKVKVLEPKLYENRPHYYKKEDCLCLYKPENFFWSESTSISQYIVTWSVCWLYFYEVWLETGDWLGPEASHEINKPK